MKMVWERREKRVDEEEERRASMAYIHDGKVEEEIKNNDHKKA